MPRTRHVATRCRFTPNQQNGFSAGSPQSVDVHLQQSEPMANIGSSSRDEEQAIPSPQPEPVVAEGPPTVPKKAPTYWTVDVIDEEGHVTQTRLRVQDAFETSHDPRRIIIKWNSNGQPIGDAAGLLAGLLGELANNFNNFPIMYENWKKVPDSYKNTIYSTKIEAKFVVNDGDNKRYILTSLGKKWRDRRCRLFAKYYDWELSLEENIQNHPPHIDKDHWAVFLQYRRSAKIMDIADKNAANREKLLIPHTLGSKTLARKRNELELQDGRKYSRGEMYTISHKKKDGSFVNEEARQKHEQLQNEIQETSSENEAFVRVFGKEHAGYVRSIGLGVTPTQVTGSTYSARSTSSSESNAKIEKLQAEVDELKEQVGQVNILREQIAFLMQNAKGNQPLDSESPRDVRRSSESSHVPGDHGASSRGTI